MTAFIRSLTATSAVVTALAVIPAFAGAQDLASMSKDSKQWVMTGRTFDLQRYSPLNQITTSNVGQLGVAWTMSARHAWHDAATAHAGAAAQGITCIAGPIA